MAIQFRRIRRRDRTRNTVIVNPQHFRSVEASGPRLGASCRETTSGAALEDIFSGIAVPGR